MAKHYYISLSILLLLSGCYISRDYVVESDYSYRSNFRKYQTYDFMIDSNPDAVTTQYRDLIDESIQFRMKLLGYKFSKDKPDLLIIYKIFDQDFNFRGYNQPQIESFIQNEDTTRKDYDPIRYDLRNGTLLIQFIDRKRRGTVWQGYTSGIRSATYNRNDRALKNAVISIFDKFKGLCNGSAKPSGILISFCQIMRLLIKSFASGLASLTPHFLFFPKMI
ncbi:MAG: DUF4136 domain-containing protein [Bacteroidia bacterium]|nr:DUF4136 domain-containing protein [Bacteroidia bacterium]